VVKIETFINENTYNKIKMKQKIKRDENFFNNLEKTIEEEIKELDSYSGRDNRFNPEYWPYTVQEYQKWLKDYHEIRGISLPKNFWKKNKKQLKGMYYGVVHNSKIKKYRYSELIKKTLEEIPAPINPQISKSLELGKIKGNVLKKEYENLKDACETYIRHSKK